MFSSVSGLLKGYSSQEISKGDSSKLESAKKARIVGFSACSLLMTLGMILIVLGATGALGLLGLIFGGIILMSALGILTPLLVGQLKKSRRLRLTEELDIPSKEDKAKAAPVEDKAKAAPVEDKAKAAPIIDFDAELAEGVEAAAAEAAEEEERLFSPIRGPSGVDCRLFNSSLNEAKIFLRKVSTLVNNSDQCCNALREARLQAEQSLRLCRLDGSLRERFYPIFLMLHVSRRSSLIPEGYNQTLICWKCYYLLAMVSLANFDYLIGLAANLEFYDGLQEDTLLKRGYSPSSVLLTGNTSRSGVRVLRGSLKYLCLGYLNHVRPSFSGKSLQEAKSLYNDAVSSCRELLPTAEIKKLTKERGEKSSPEDRDLITKNGEFLISVLSKLDEDRDFSIDVTFSSLTKDYDLY